MKFTVHYTINNPAVHRLAPIEGQVEVEAPSRTSALESAVTKIFEKGSFGRDDVFSLAVDER